MANQARASSGRTTHQCDPFRSDACTVVGEPGEAAIATEPSTPSDSRVFLRDIKPYAIVDDLDQLQGPAGGVVELPHSVLWAPGGSQVDLDEPGGRGLAYRALLAEATVEDLVQFLNRDQLIAAWPELLLPHRVREMWEARFPELQSAPINEDASGEPG